MNSKSIKKYKVRTSPSLHTYICEGGFLMFKKRRYRPRKGPLPFRYVFLISFIIFSVMTVQGLWIVEKGIRPTLIAIAKTETQRIGTLAINEAVSKKILENTDMDELIQIQQDNSGKIISVGFNPVIYNRVLQQTTQRVQSYLNDISLGKVKDLAIPDSIEIEQDGERNIQNGIIHTIPLGQASNNALLAHLGPKVPVRLTAIGDVKSQLSESIIPVGINNTYIRVSVDITVDVKVVIPFATDTHVVETSIPVGMVFVQGEVPDFYNSGGTDGMPMPAIINQSELEKVIDDRLEDYN